DDVADAASGTHAARVRTAWRQFARAQPAVGSGTGVPPGAYAPLWANTDLWADCLTALGMARACALAQASPAAEDSVRAHAWACSD
ncbi:hypothetical protein OFN94_36255, partial [Escherichia coli]|nr:hypothetical protein [Escherichia coli]